MNANQPRQRCVFSLRFCSANLPDLNGSTNASPRHIRGGEWKWRQSPRDAPVSSSDSLNWIVRFLGTERRERRVMEFCEFN